MQAMLQRNQPTERQYEPQRKNPRIYPAGLGAPTMRYLRAGNQSAAEEARIRPALPRAMPVSIPRHEFPGRSAALVTASPVGIITLVTASPSAAIVVSSPPGNPWGTFRVALSMMNS